MLTHRAVPIQTVLSERVGGKEYFGVSHVLSG